MVNKPKSGRPKKIDQNFERRIMREIKKNPFQSSSKISKAVNNQIEEEKTSFSSKCEEDCSEKWISCSATPGQAFADPKTNKPKVSVCFII